MLQQQSQNSIPSVADHEYHDYSCSTSVERLSRDVESCFRAWHVDRGSDRHVEAATGSRIRAETIVWSLSGRNSGGTVVSTEVELELVLWDDPADTTETETDESVPTLNQSLDSDDLSLVGATTSLPAPLARREGVDLPFRLFDNFSTVFGIGQHITLSPIQPDTCLPDDVRIWLATMTTRRHQIGSVRSVVAVLTTWLQSALNMAAHAGDCCFPLLGVWGKYNPSDDKNGRGGGGDDTLFPPWWTACVAPASPPQPSPRGLLYRRRRRDAQDESSPHTVNTSFLPPILSGQLRSGAGLNNCRALFRCHALQAGSEKWVQHPVRWTTWADMLQRHCRANGIDNADASVQLWAARHTYGWYKEQQQQKHTQIDWRTPSPPEPVPGTPEEIVLYRQECRQVALWLLETAARTDVVHNPLWGPRSDPMASVRAVVTWNSPHPPGGDSTERMPLLLLPLKVRSAMTLKDRLEMEESVAKSVLDPTRAPCLFEIQVAYDDDATEASLAA